MATHFQNGKRGIIQRTLSCSVICFSAVYLYSQYVPNNPDLAKIWLNTLLLRHIIALLEALKLHWK